MSAQPAAFPGFSDRLARVWSRWMTKPGTFTALSVGLFAVPVVSTALLVFTVAGALSMSGTPAASAWGSFAAAGVGLLAVGIVSIGFQTATAAAAAFKVGLGRALKVGFANVLHLLFLQLIIGLVLVLPSMIVIPGLVLTVRFALAIPVMIAERRYGFEALARSRDLVRGKTLALFLEVLAMSVLAAVLTAVSQVVAALAAGTVGSASGKALVTSAVLALFLLPIVPMFFVHLQVFYEDRVILLGRDWAPHPSRVRLYKILALLGLLMTVGVGLLGARGVSIVRDIVGGSKQPPAVTQPTVEPEVKPAEKPAEPAPEPTAADRDLERYRHIDNLRIALTTHFNDNRGYPETLDGLLPKYLTKIPVDPATGERYLYVAELGGFTMTFVLEEGIFSLSKGEHVLTPRGFDVPITEQIVQEEVPPTTVTEEPPEVPTEPVNPLPPMEEAPPAETDSDTDGDGLVDEDERSIGTDPQKTDTDGDGIDDRTEIYVYKTNPTNPDTDGDGFTDGDEVYGGFDPSEAGKRLTDGDGDGLADLYEATNGLNPENRDMDRDGLSDGDELRVYRTDPQKADTDEDGFSDPAELQGGYEPTGEGPLTEERKEQIRQDTAKYGLY